MSYNIGVDARLLQNKELRGMGKYLYKLVENILKIDQNIIFTAFIDGRYPDPKMPISERIEKVSLIMKGDAYFLWEQYKLPKSISKTKAELLHSPANTLPLWQCIPTVVTLHDTLLMERDEDETSNFLFYTRKIIPFGLKKAQKIITISENSKKDIIRHFEIPASKIEVIYLGIDDYFKIMENKGKVEQVKAKIGITGEYIYHLGSLGPRKNTDKVLEAFAVLKKDKKIKEKLVISSLSREGVKKYENKIREMSLEGEVIITSYVKEDELVSLYNGAKLFLYLSLYEGFGFPVVEAMACGCPVIVSNVSSMPELVNDPELLVDPMSTADIANRIYSLINNHDMLREKRDKGQKRAKLFNWQETAQKTLKVYDSVRIDTRKICQ